MKDVKMAVLVLVICSCAISCSTRPILYRQVVDLKPLQDLRPSHDFHSLDPAFADYSLVVRNGVHVQNGQKNGYGVVDWRRWSEHSHDFLGLRVDVMLFDSIASAIKLFDFDTEEKSEFVSRSGEGDDRYFIGPVKQDRSDVFGNPPMGYFYSEVIVQKRNLLIRIDERTDRLDAQQKENSIHDVAARLNPLMQE